MAPVELVEPVELDESLELETTLLLEGLFGSALLDGLLVLAPVRGPKEELVVSLVVCVEDDAKLVSGGEKVIVGSVAAESLVGPQADTQKPHTKSPTWSRWFSHACPNDCNEAVQLLAGGMWFLVSMVFPARFEVLEIVTSEAGRRRAKA